MPKIFTKGCVCMRLTVEQYNELMLELETSINHFESLKSCVQTRDDERKLDTVIEALKNLCTIS